MIYQILYGRIDSHGYRQIDNLQNVEMKQEEIEQIASFRNYSIEYLEHIKPENLPECFFCYFFQTDKGKVVIIGKNTFLKAAPLKGELYARDTVISHQYILNHTSYEHIITGCVPDYFFQGKSYCTQLEDCNLKEVSDETIFQAAEKAVSDEELKNLSGILGIHENNLINFMNMLFSAMSRENCRLYVCLPSNDRNGSEAVLRFSIGLLERFPPIIMTDFGFITYQQTFQGQGSQDGMLPSRIPLVFILNKEKNINKYNLQNNDYIFDPWNHFYSPVNIDKVTAIAFEGLSKIIWEPENYQQNIIYNLIGKITGKFGGDFQCSIECLVNICQLYTEEKIVKKCLLGKTGFSQYSYLAGGKKSMKDLADDLYFFVDNLPYIPEPVHADLIEFANGVAELFRRDFYNKSLKGQFDKSLEYLGEIYDAYEPIQEILESFIKECLYECQEKGNQEEFLKIYRFSYASAKLRTKVKKLYTDGGAQNG